MTRAICRSIWTDEEATVARSMAGQGASATEIGMALGRTRRSVLGYCHRSQIDLQCGMAVPPKPKAKRKQRQRQVFGPRKPQEHKPAPFIPYPQAPTKTAIAFNALPPHTCRWIYGRAAYDAPTCGLPAISGSSWCVEHARLVFQP